MAFPLVKDVIQEIGDAQPEVISVIDLQDAYHTLRLEDFVASYHIMGLHHTYIKD